MNYGILFMLNKKYENRETKQCEKVKETLKKKFNLQNIVSY